MQILEMSAPAVRSAGRKASLSPAQQAALEGLLLGLERGSLAVLRDTASDGKTTVLNHLRDNVGGVRVGIRDFLRRLSLGAPVAMEEAFAEMVGEALAATDLLMVDDLNRIRDICDNCNNPRAGLFEAALTAVLDQAAGAGKKLVFATDSAPLPLLNRGHAWFIADLQPADYEAICSAYLDPAIVRRMNFAEIHRFAPSLNAHQLRKAAEWLAHEPGADTARALDYLAKHNLESNVEIGDVEPVDLRDLKGLDDVIRELEAKVALPLADRALAAEWNLKPKRGVLLAGPPGTGKTTIGRALAHRLKGKFFLIDGTLIAGSQHFYGRVNQVFEAARRNAPSVVFIDDADVIFEGDNGDRGLYRYLLTQLDGLEGASAGRVCVMMTAMHASSLPAAILRSGRVEVWLETRLPDEAARLEILRALLAGVREPLSAVDWTRIAQASRGLTGADLKAAVEDAKLMFAHDRAAAGATRSAERYFLDAIEGIRRNRRDYAKKRRVDFGESRAIGYPRVRAVLPGDEA